MNSQNLVWIDLEMTGLYPDKHTILEIATIVTDANLNILAQGPNLIIHQSPEVLAQMEPKVIKLLSKHGLIDAVKSSSVTLETAQQTTLAFIQPLTDSNTSPLCGNSVYRDRMFLEKYMPTLNNYLHYRLIDVSTVKELARRWYPQIPPFIKGETHRALDDIKESIQELKYFREKIFNVSES